MCGLRSQCLIVTAFTIDGLLDWYMICMKHLQTIHVWFKYQTVWGLYNHYQSWQSNHKAAIWIDSWNTTHKNGLLLGMVDPTALLALVAQKSEDYGWLIFELLHVTFDFFSNLQHPANYGIWQSLYLMGGWPLPPCLNFARGNQKIAQRSTWIHRSAPWKVPPRQGRLMAAGKAQWPPSDPERAHVHQWCWRLCRAKWRLRSHRPFCSIPEWWRMQLETQWFLYWSGGVPDGFIPTSCEERWKTPTASP